jgi:hypothetical protein
MEYAREVNTGALCCAGGETMKALTLWQPWASLIADGRKTIETRPRPWYFRGLVAIHAGLKVDREACVRFGYDPDTIPRGCIVAVARKGDCVQFPSALAPEDEYGNFAAGRYGYLLPVIFKLKEPIKASGMQGFWNWETDGLPVCTTHDGLIRTTWGECWRSHVPNNAVEVIHERVHIEQEGKSIPVVISYTVDDLNALKRVI